MAAAFSSDPPFFTMIEWLICCGGRCFGARIGAVVAMHDATIVAPEAENAEHKVFSFDDSASTESRSRRFRPDPYDRDRRSAADAI
jgi:hypothetical protein